MIEPSAASLGLDIVRVRVTGGQTPTLQIMAELPDGTMTVARCARLSRAISPVLEAEDPISSEYHLEVSSPGIDRPLTRVGDFAKWIGHEVKIELGAPGADGRKRFQGSIVAETDGVVDLDLKDGGAVRLAVSDMAKASLVLTEKLIQAARAKGQAPADEFDPEDDVDFDDIDVDDEEAMELLDGEDEDLGDGEDDVDERK